jgi:hypothetical protein
VVTPAREANNVPDDFDDTVRHREFLLNALRLAAIRAKLVEQTVTTIGVALKSDMIGPETAVAWIRDENLLWWVGNLPETTQKLVPSS